MASELQGLLVQAGLDEHRALAAATVWLQNVVNAPLLVRDDDHILAFCEERGVTAEELIDTADRLGLAVNMLDDLLAFERAAQQADALLQSADSVQEPAARQP